MDRSLRQVPTPQNRERQHHPLGRCSAARGGRDSQLRQVRTQDHRSFGKDASGPTIRISPSTGVVNLNNLVKSSRSIVIQAWSRSAAEDIGRAEQLHLDIFEQDTGSSFAHSTMGMVPSQTPGRSVADRAQGAARGAAVAAFAPRVLIPRFARDSLLEEAGFEPSVPGFGELGRIWARAIARSPGWLIWPLLLGERFPHTGARKPAPRTSFSAPCEISQEDWIGRPK